MDIVIKQLDTFEEKLEAERLIATSFLHEWKQEDAEESAKNPNGEAWAAYDESGHMVTAMTSLGKDIIYEGNSFSCSELHMVGSLPEARGKGAVRKIMIRVLKEYKARGDLFTFLIPFSFAFYRKYGFELASEILVQKIGIDQFAGFHQDMTACQIKSQSQVDEAHRLYDAYIRSYNLGEIKDDYCWTYNENQEFGQRDWQNADKTHYSYLFYDKDGHARAYFTFLFIHGPEGPFTGTMKVTELVYDSPEALENVFAFFYGMRAKIKEVELELPRDMDLSYMLPECDKVRRSLDGHMTARALNIDKILQAMGQPQGKGTYSIHITDTFLPENTGTYRVDFEEGKTLKVMKNEEAADLDISAETFCQLSVGLIDLGQAMYRPATRLKRNNRWLKEVFVRKPLFLC